MSVPPSALEASIEAEIQRLNGGNAEPPADEPTADEPPPEEEAHEEEGLEEGEGPDDQDEPDEEEEESSERVAAPDAKRKKPPRENETIRQLRERAQAAEQRAAAFEAERQRQESERQQREAQEAMRREDAEVAALPPEEQPAARQAIFQKRAATEILRQQRVLNDMQDREGFRTNADADPVLKAISPMVENIAQQYIRAGHQVNRDTIADAVLGRLYRTREGRAQLERLQAANSRPRTKKKVPAGRGNSAGGGRSKRDGGSDPSREQLINRLKDKLI